MVVVVLSTRGSLGLGGSKGFQQLAVEELIVELRMEALSVPILPGTAWGDVEDLDAQSFELRREMH
jgi:hypothetical protein